MNLQQVRKSLIGDWVSLAPEIRPSASKNPMAASSRST